MITGIDSPAAVAIYDKLIGAPQDWLSSPKGRQLIANCFRHVRKHCSQRQAMDLRDSLYSAYVIGGSLRVPDFYR